MQKLVELDKFCCGCSMKTGALTVGVFSVIFPIIGYCVDGIQGLSLFKIFVLCEGYITYTILLVVSLILIFGVVKEISKCMLPWLIFYMISLIYTPIYAVIQSVGQLIDGNFMDGVAILICLIISMAVNIYFWLVVYTHFRDLMKNFIPAPAPQPTMVQSA